MMLFWLIMRISTVRRFLVRMILMSIGPIGMIPKWSGILKIRRCSMIKYLLIHPSGKVECFDFCNMSFHDACSSVLGCSWLEFVRTTIYPITLVIDGCGALEPQRPLNRLASMIYGGAPYGAYIYGPAIVFSESVSYEGADIAPLSDFQINLLVSLWGIDKSKII